MSTAGKRKGWRELAKFRETYEYGDDVDHDVSDNEYQNNSRKAKKGLVKPKEIGNYDTESDSESESVVVNARPLDVAKYREMGGGNIKNAAAVKSRLTCDFSPGNHVIDNASRALPSWKKNYFETKWPFMGHQCGIGGCFGRQIIQRLHPSGGWDTRFF